MSPVDCEHFTRGEDDSQRKKGQGDSIVPWTGNTLGSTALSFVAARSPTRLVALIGATGAGKTTFLTMEYLLLARGYAWADGSFAGSVTLEAWENLARHLRLQSPDQPRFPPHTPAQAGRFPGMLHLSFRRSNDRMDDVVITDAPGEWFEEWAIDQSSENAEGARWIGDHAHAFLLFVDCEALAGPVNEAAQTFSQTVRLASRVRDVARGRAVGIIWAKSDRTPADTYRTRLLKTFNSFFPDHAEFHVTVESANDPDDGRRREFIKAMSFAAAQGTVTRPSLIVPTSTYSTLTIEMAQ